jgi:signal transduction histidine kinase
VTAALSFNDRAAAAEYVEPMQVNHAIEAVGVYAKDGTLVAGFARKGTARLPEPVFARESIAKPYPQSVVVPVAEHNTALGAVYVRESPEPMASRLSRYIVLALLAVMAALVVAALGNAQMKLQRQARRLASANLQLQSEMAERANAEEALRQSQKMEAIGQLSGGIAHDFNNHLMIIKGNLHLLQRKLNLSAGDRHIAAMLEGVNRAAALTQRVLSFSRKQALSPTIVDLNELVAGMDDLIRSSLRENVEVVQSLGATRRVVLDRNQMENVILNLVINARDAMPQGGSLFVSTEDTDIGPADAEADEILAGCYVKLAIRDTGAGMSEEILAKALDPFFTTKPVGQGTGLGLSTTYGFIRQSGGHLNIDSAPAHGTTISIFLPCVASETGIRRDKE